MAEEEVAGALWPALLAARRASKGVGKTGRNQAQGWSFVTVEDVTREALRCLNDAGLVAVLCTRPPTDNLTQLDGWLHVVHAETGETIRFDITWPVARPNDQGLRAAYSYARKQALVELLMIAEPDDPETSAGHAQRPAMEIRDTETRPRDTTPPKPSPNAVKAMWAGLRATHGSDEPTIRRHVADVLGIAPDWSTNDLSARQVSTVLNNLGPREPTQPELG